jgi:hypothetical protein
MTMPAQGSRARVHPPRRYVRPIVAVHFPSGEEVPETHRHLELRTALYQTVQRALGDRATVGSEQFIFWDPSDPKQRCAPDLMVRFGVSKRGFDSWKVWEDGAPELAVEIISASDASPAAWRRKIARYRKLGVRELVGFDPALSGQPLRIWDHVDGDLVERDPSDPAFCRSDALDAFWCVRTDVHGELELRVANDAAGTDLWLTPAEAERQHAAALEAEIETLRRR